MWENAAPLPENEPPRPPARCAGSEEAQVVNFVFGGEVRLSEKSIKGFNCFIYISLIDKLFYGLQLFHI